MWGEPRRCCCPCKISPFQLTRPVWGEPIGQTLNGAKICHFNSLAPCGANPHFDFDFVLLALFQLTRPVWGEPRLNLNLNRKTLISTHSPRVGRTNQRTKALLRNLHFNSLAPCGANHAAALGRCVRRQFQLTRPVWGEPQYLQCW